MKKKKIKSVLILSVFFTLCSLGFLAFPNVSNYINQQITEDKIDDFKKIDERIVDVYDEETNDPLSLKQAQEKERVDSEGYLIEKHSDGTTKRISETPVVFKADLDRLYQDSVKYNETLKTKQNKLLVNDLAYKAPSLKLSDYGIYDNVYGYVSVSKIGLNLPIILGASENSMSLGAAHLTYTSLPIGGKSTNCVLAGHTGYVGRTFFDYITLLEIGDKVKVTNLWNSLDYSVKDVKVFSPEQAKAIFISPDKDILTLFTCIRNSKGEFDRYFVICERS